MTTTEKQGETVDFNTVKRARSTNLAQLTKLYKELEKNMMNYDNVDNVKSLYNKLCERFDQFKSVHLQCLDVCTEADVITDLELSYESCHKNFVEFRDRFSQYIADVKMPDDDDGGSIVSRVSSAASSASSKSKLHSARAKRMIAEHRIKKLREKHALERAHRNIERERQEIEEKQQLLEQQSELEEATLEETIWSEVVDGVPEVVVHTEQLRTNVDLTADESVAVAEGCQTESTEYRQEQESRKHTGSGNVTLNNNNCKQSVSGSSAAIVDSTFERLVTALHEGFNLPKPELLTFSGKPTDYNKFIRNFEANIESKVSDDRVKLSYLIQYCKGEARSCIEDCVMLDHEQGYARARSILLSRYGRPHVIARAYVESLVYGPQIKASDTNGLLNLALEMQKCEITLTQLGFTCDIDNSENLRRIVKRLPMHMRVKWAEIAHCINESGREPRFTDLAEFVNERSRVANSMYGLDIVAENSVKASNQSTGHTNKQKVTTLATSSNHNTDRRENRCCYCCKGTCTDLTLCDNFKAITLEERRKLVRKLKLCYNCLKGKHFVDTCRKPSACTVPECKLKHNILLHSWVKPGSDHTAAQSAVHSCETTKKTTIKNFLGIIPVVVKGKSGTFCETYALLDNGADKTLVDERLLETLDVQTKPVSFQVSTICSRKTNIGKELDLEVQAVDSEDKITLRKVWSVKRLPISRRSAPENSDIRNLPYLEDITLPDIGDTDVMLLIGTDAPEAHVPLEIRSGGADQPYAVRTRLGWAVRGPTGKKDTSEEVSVNYQRTDDNALQQQLERMWTADFIDTVHSEKSLMSVEDKRAFDVMKKSLTFQNGHYKMGMPWRDVEGTLPDNLPLAHARLQQLKKKLSKDSEMHKMYTTAITDYIEKGYATEVSMTNTCSKRVWYLPHHPVQNENKPGKVRVVFDCAAKYQGISLNSQLMQGPDLMNTLLGVVIRFRQEKVALAADIEAMFHQVRVKQEDCDALRFLWWPNGDISKQPKTYRMQVHLFGATSSPSCAAYALKRTAEDNADKFDAEIISTVDKNFYVDDCLKSVDSEEKAVKVATDLQSLMRMGGFRLTKWLSNCREVLQEIPESERAPSVVNLSPDDTLPQDRALGISWDVERDKIVFHVKIADKPMTRRGILSILSSIYDPLGLVSPITLRAKLILQKLCRLKIGWDDPVPQIHRDEWNEWLKSLPAIESVSVNRCYKPKDFGSVKNVQLHIFSDGSEVGYGACAYIRQVDEHGDVTCSLVVGKSRLAPIKQMSIPRIELSGAVVASRLYELVRDELDINIDQVVFWTDSTITLGYINNVTSRFKTFVGNRLSVIHSASAPEQWRYVNSLANPADIASRGIDANNSAQLNRWLFGPEFLLKGEDEWPEKIKPKDTLVDDVEVKRDVNVHATTSTALDALLTRYSDWRKLTRSFAWIKRFQSYCRWRYLKHETKPSTGDISADEIRDATHSIVAMVQGCVFQEEIDSLRHGKFVRKESRLATLNPELQNGLIVIKGRWPSNSVAEYPVVLPDKHHVTVLIIRSIHESNGHAGIQQVLARSRLKYWIIRGQSTVKHELRNCNKCKRLQGQCCKQIMAPLLVEQTTPDKPPFTFVGVDFFGPLLVKSNPEPAKRYGCLFTCLTTRAVHFEVTHSLTTSSFIAALQRFTSRRGVPEKVYSDNGTNLVSGDRELQTSIRQWNKSQLSKFMSQREITWHHNPPYASHMGGTWERLIRSTRKILKAVAGEQLLTDEQLLTFITEVERILNDRPITQVSNDPNDPPALTPSMLLLMKCNSSIPQGVFKKEDMYCKRWWRQVQYLADIFWKRWVREYLPALQIRQKWQRPTKDVQNGDVVLVADEKLPRGQWPLGRIVEVKNGRDGHVRSCVIKTQNSTIIRPVSKLCLLESACYSMS